MKKKQKKNKTKKTLEINKKGTFSEIYFLNSTILN